MAILFDAVATATSPLIPSIDQCKGQGGEGEGYACFLVGGDAPADGDRVGAGGDGDDEEAVVATGTRWQLGVVEGDAPSGVIHEAEDGVAWRGGGDGCVDVLGGPASDSNGGWKFLGAVGGPGWIVSAGCGFGVGGSEEAHFGQRLRDQAVVGGLRRVFVGAFESFCVEGRDLGGDVVFIVAGEPEEERGEDGHGSGEEEHDKAAGGDGAAGGLFVADGEAGEGG